MQELMQLRNMAGLYGKHLPQTVANFLTLVKSGAYQGTAISKVCLQAAWEVPGNPWHATLSVLLPSTAAPRQPLQIYGCCMHRSFLGST